MFESRYPLNQEQTQAVLKGEGSLLILAGAGTGKTRVVTYRIAHLVKECGVHPAEILALTFTNKAAREMRERVEELVGPMGRGMQLSTFHSCCARWLRRWGYRIGLGSNFSIYDQDDRKALLKTVAESLGRETDKAALRSYANRVERARYQALLPRDLHERSRNQDDEDFAELFERYEEALLRANACDFGSLISHMVHLLEQDQLVRDSLQRRYRFVMVDEFQDTNVAQYRLLKALAPPGSNVAVVGDDDQAIYGWRGATVENVTRFRDEFKAEIIALEENYRSTATILAAAHEIVSRLPARMDKRLRTSRQDDGPIKVFVGDDDRDEADYVARTIEKKVEQGARWGDFAVIYRTNAQSRVLEERLRGRGIPHQIIGGLSFFERKEVKDLIAYLRLAVNPHDDMALLRVINTPTRAIGAGTVKKLQLLRESRELRSLNLAVRSQQDSPLPRLQKKTKSGLSELADLLVTLETEGGSIAPDDLLRMIRLQTGYDHYLAESDVQSADERLRNIDELQHAAALFHDEWSASLDRDSDSDDEDGVEISPVAAFLEYAALRSPTDIEGQDEGNVQLLTVHASKGLEFPHVFVTGMEDDLFPLRRKGDAPSSEHSDEERRLCYVAMTRAQESLYLCAAKRRRVYGTTRHNDASPFLQELRPSHWEMSAESVSTRLTWSSQAAAQSAWSGDWATGQRAAQKYKQTAAPSWEHFNQSRPSTSTDAPPDFDFDQRGATEREGSESSSSFAIPERGLVFDEAAPTSTSSTKVGRQVRHKLFGVGIVRAQEGSSDRLKLTIDFPEKGVTKKVVERYVEYI